MKRMLTLSFAIHLTAGALFVLLAWMGEKQIEGSIYTVNLITPAAEHKRAAPEPKRAPPEQKREASRKAPPKPRHVKPSPPKKLVKRPPAPPSMLERQISKLEAAYQKQPSPPEPPKPAVPPSPSVPETKDHPLPQEQAAVHPPVATATMAVPHFKYPFYQAQIERRIGALWSPPPLEVGSEGEETIVSFQLNRSGRIEDVKIEKSSGNSFYDQAALRAVYEADPLPPWPEGLHTDSLKIYFRFELSNKT
jgi:TonB family protein